MFFTSLLFTLAYECVKIFLFIALVIFLTGVSTDFFCLFILGRFFPCKRVWESSSEEKGRRWVIITGADSGIGRSYALELARRKFNICVINREPKESRSLDQCLVGLGVSVKRIVFNFSEADQEKRKVQEDNLKAEVTPLLPFIHILINNVGTMGKADYSNVMCPLFKMTSESSFGLNDTEEIIRVNQDSVLFLTRLIVPSMIQRRSGVVINICSLCSYDGIWGSAIYCATKAFVFVFTESLRQELSDYNIVVQAVTPGFVNTKLLSPSLRELLPSFVNVSPDSVALGSLTVLGWQSVTHGCLLHSIQNRALLVMRTLCFTWIHDIIIRFFTKQLSEVSRGSFSRNKKLLD